MKIAILDYDNTLSNGLTRYESGYAMESAGLIPKGFKDELTKLENRYVDGEIDYNKKYLDDKKIFSKYFNGLKRVEAVRFLEQEFDISKMINPWSSDLIKLLQKYKYLTVVVSGSWDYIIEVAQDLLDFEAFFASEFEIVDGKFTENYKQILTYERKGVITEELLQGASESIGLGDSIADLSFLDHVDHPFMYEPENDAIEAVKGREIQIVNRKNILEEFEKVL